MSLACSLPMMRSSLSACDSRVKSTSSVTPVLLAWERSMGVWLSKSKKLTADCLCSAKCF